MIRRFYNDVTLAQVSGAEVPGAWQVLLDGRGVKTVGGAAQIAPTHSLGEALAAEWRLQGDTIDPASLPLRDLTDYAIDVVAADPATIVQGMVSYGETDTLCYRADPGEPLHAHQLAVWEPLLTRFEAAHNIAFVRVSGILHRDQPPETLAVLRARLLTLDPFTLAAAETMTTLAASLVIALTALDASGEDDPLTQSQAAWQAAWQTVCLEEEWQAELWGRDEDAEHRRARRESDFLRACAFTQLVRR